MEALINAKRKNTHTLLLSQYTLLSSFQLTQLLTRHLNVTWCQHMARHNRNNVNTRVFMRITADKFTLIEDGTGQNHFSRSLWTAWHRCQTLKNVRVHRFLVELNPPFLDQNCSFTGHLVASPATIFAKKPTFISPAMEKKTQTLFLVFVRSVTNIQKFQNLLPWFYFHHLPCFALPSRSHSSTEKLHILGSRRSNGALLST